MAQTFVRDCSYRSTAKVLQICLTVMLCNYVVKSSDYKPENNYNMATFVTMGIHNVVSLNLLQYVRQLK